MTLYESNYIRLRRLVGDFDELPYESVSSAPGDVDLVLRREEQSRYTTTYTLTYRFLEDGETSSDPDLLVRVYHDARLTEVLGGASRHRHPLLTEFAAGTPGHMDVRWRRNMMLNKWLEYCTERGHSFSAPI